MAKKKKPQTKKNVARSAMKVKPKRSPKVKVRASAKRQAPGVARRNARKANSGGAAERDGVFRRLFDRTKHIFKQPLDPRIKHLVEVFGTEAVVGLMDAYRKRQDDAHQAELREAMAQAEAVAPPIMHGSWVWHELMTSNTAGAKRFYREMFGWTANDIEMMPGFYYTTFTKNGKDLGGMMAIGPEHGDMTPGWGVYIAVDDVDSAADKAEDLGGQIVVPAHDIPVGRWAMVKDPAGAVICLYKSKS